MIDPQAVPSGMGSDLATAFGKAAPPTVVSAAVLAGYTLQDWVVVLTAIFLALQIAYLTYKFQREVRRDARADATKALENSEAQLDQIREDQP